MAILDVFKKEDGDKKEKAAPKASAVKEKSTPAPKAKAGAAGRNHGAVITRPYITEKAAMLSEQNAYTFEVRPGANKTEVAKAVKDVYGVVPVKVRVVNLPAKSVFSRGKAGSKSGKRKAIVYLKKGDTIEFV